MTVELISIAEESVRLAKKFGFEEAIAKVVHINETMVKAANNVLTVTQGWSNRRLDIYLTKKKKIYVASTQFSDLSDIEQFIRTASENIEKLTPSELYAPLPQPEADIPSEKIIDVRIVDGQDKAPNYAEAMLNAALEEGASRAAAVLSFIHEKKAICFNGVKSSYEESTALKTYLRAFKDSYSGMWSFGSRRLEVQELENVGRIAARFATMANKKVKVEPVNYQVILSPIVAGNIFNYVALFSSAFYVLTNMSFLGKYKPGDKIASEMLSMYDSPRSMEIPGSTNFDDEGLKTKNKAIIEKGVFRTLLHNSKTARLFNTEPTGNAGFIAPISWNVVISNGDSSLDEMIKETREGLIVTSNWYTRLQNYVEGTFSTVPRDALLYIKDGEVMGDAGRLRIADSFPNLLSNIELLSKESYKIWWWEVGIPTQSPYIKVSSLHITKPEL